MTYNHCRFCKKFEVDSTKLFNYSKYSPRHHAHFKCYLEAGKTLDNLSPWQAVKFPYLLLKERGLLDHPKLKEAS